MEINFFKLRNVIQQDKYSRVLYEQILGTKDMKVTNKCIIILKLQTLYIDKDI